jgi:hypothetical protein
VVHRVVLGVLAEDVVVLLVVLSQGVKLYNLAGQFQVDKVVVLSLYMVMMGEMDNGRVMVLVVEELEVSVVIIVLRLVA